ncbi:MAG TPA: hypothetical protein VNH63_11060 [Gemmatimonadales bacterium]|nr:hypothetical protein [Gemmatimonadales bacterium]
MPRHAAVLALAAFAACGGPRSGSPACGLALLAGPTLIVQRLGDARALLLDAPRGLPDRLPLRIVGHGDQSTMLVGYQQGQLVLRTDGDTLPAVFTNKGGNDSTGYALLVADDSTNRVEGALVYESQRPPASFPHLGSLTDGSRTIPLFGVKVDWASMNNLACPLLGPPASPPKK